MSRIQRETAIYATGELNNRVAKLALYKECIAVARVLPGPAMNAQIALIDARKLWRERRGDVLFSTQIHLAEAVDRLAFGRMQLSKQRLRNLPNASERYNWAIYRPGEPVDVKRTNRLDALSSEMGKKAAGNRDFVPMTNWGQNNVDPDIRAKHKELTDKQHFMGPHWRNRPLPVNVNDLSFEEQFRMYFRGKPKTRPTPKKHF